MEHITAVLAWIKAHGAEILALWAGIIGVAEIIVKWTDSKKDDEILGKIPSLEDGKQYTLLLHIHNKPISDTLSYPLFMIAAMLLKGYDASTKMHCIVEHSADSQNHFTLLRRK